MSTTASLASRTSLKNSVGHLALYATEIEVENSLDRQPSKSLNTRPKHLNSDNGDCAPRRPVRRGTLNDKGGSQHSRSSTREVIRSLFSAKGSSMKQAREEGLNRGLHQRRSVQRSRSAGEASLTKTHRTVVRSSSLQEKLAETLKLRSFVQKRALGRSKKSTNVPEVKKLTPSEEFEVEHSCYDDNSCFEESLRSNEANRQHAPPKKKLLKGRSSKGYFNQGLQEKMMDISCDSWLTEASEKPHEPRSRSSHENASVESSVVEDVSDYGDDDIEKPFDVSSSRTEVSTLPPSAENFFYQSTLKTEGHQSAICRRANSTSKVCFAVDDKLKIKREVIEYDAPQQEDKTQVWWTEKDLQATERELVQEMKMDLKLDRYKATLQHIMSHSAKADSIAAPILTRIAESKWRGVEKHLMPSLMESQTSIVRYISMLNQSLRHMPADSRAIAVRMEYITLNQANITLATALAGGDEAWVIQNIEQTKPITERPARRFSLF